jgi:ADP-ribose pyrophosphatase
MTASGRSLRDEQLPSEFCSRRRRRSSEECRNGDNAVVHPWKLVSEDVWRAPSGFMRLLTRRFEMPDGRLISWDLVDGQRTVAVLALTPDDRVLLARQFRPGPGLVMDEMPGGYVEPDEDPAAAAARELREETGYVGEIEVLASTWLSATATTQRYVAIARNCVASTEADLDDDEFIEVVGMPLHAFREILRGGEMTDIDLAYLALDHLGVL